MARTIHVPWGCAARVARNSAVLDISSLFAEGIRGPTAFVVCASHDRASLFFIDGQSTSGQAEEEVEWVSEGFEEPPLLQAFVNNPSGRAVIDALQINGRQLKVVDLSLDDHGILVALTRKDCEKDWRTGVMTFVRGTFEGELLRHPLEREYLAARAVNMAGGVTAQQEHLLFDGRHWEALSPSDVQPCQETAAFQALKQAFRLPMSHTASLALVQNFMMWPQGKAEEAGMLAFHTRDYFCDFQADTPFCIDMEQALTDIAQSPTTAPSSLQDNELLVALQAALVEEGTAYEQIKGLCTPHAASAKLTAFLSAVLGAFQVHAAFHLRRQQYVAHQSTLKGCRSSCHRFSAEGAALLRENQHAAASAKFLQSLHEATLCCTKQEPELATAYYNLGRCCELRGQFTEAAFFLNNCLTLRSHFDSGGERWRKADAAVNRVERLLK